MPLKIIKIRKRNPSEISKEGWEKINRNKKNTNVKELIEDTFEYGNPYFLSYLINLINQGFRCEDCDKIYVDCKCEHCENCKFDRCLCPLGFTADEYYEAYEEESKEFYSYNNKVQKVTWEFAKLVLSKDQLKDLLKKHPSIKLKITSSFPKEREIMIRLFDLD